MHARACGRALRASDRWNIRNGRIIARYQCFRCSISCSDIEHSERKGRASCVSCRLRRIIRAMARALDLHRNKELGGYSPQRVLRGRVGGGLGSFALRGGADRLGAAGEGERSQLLAVVGAASAAPTTSADFCGFGVVQLVPVAPGSSQRGAGSADFCGSRGPRLLTACLPTRGGPILIARRGAAAAAGGRRGGGSPFGPSPRTDARSDREAGNLENSALPMGHGCGEFCPDHERKASHPRTGSGVRGRAKSASGAENGLYGIPVPLGDGFGWGQGTLHGEGAGRLGGGRA